ncbi:MULTISPECIES: type I pullulanase [Parabacteroides]|uniref:Type I pullulanase n=7 Tax=Parabacteroides goldsteinii TaxID=328812 RepID=A0A6G1ZCZ4_9BACT|nr:MULTISPECIES: type I pullulanase [Parabacteroides]EOS18980.1 pullulanase, type I [Parabacteroides goldsteinii dnLKV18]KAI4361329.1 Pullulanase [Parabacteroides sp. ASF519]MBF0765470.1 type I pullulanase [Parabacteroides goldsteinii]MDZ3929862.1 type I pullulanase [Parabacteroides goldsteinii]MRX93976.1 type I pullulanase [Parabacteroides goldsteinii]
METLTDHPSTERLDSYDKYPSYYGSDLELVYTPEQSVFTLWAPSADRVRLNLYASGEGGDPEEQVEMEKAGYGTWRIHIDRDLKGSFYTFQIEKNGKWLNETPGIWAKAVGINGNRAAVIDWNETNPEGWESDRSPELKMYSDIILYELHHRDFSIAPDSGIENKGKFLALTETGTKTPEGEATGLDHLKELGVTHIHILPSFDFATVDETKLDENHYNWGYDPKNYNVPDGSYSTDPANPVVRIREFKEMVKSLHQNGFRIVLDVVYNHTASTDHSNFDLTVPGYFYRQNADGSYSNASGCGNETASEREMVRHYIIESVKFWAREYHIDGFRFDLMGIHDIETMNHLRSGLLEIDPTIFVYGEGWVAADSPLPFEQRAVKENVGQMEGIGVFNDEFRDGLKGSTFDEQEPGYASGNINGHFEPVKYGIVGGTDHPQVDYGGLLYCNAPYAGAPSQMINFVSCHDGYTLVDKLKLSVQGDHAADELIPIDKLVHTVLLTAQGIPFIRSGEEIMQDKQGEPNSYKSPDSINRIDWSLKAKNREVFDFIRGLIALRKAHPAFRIPTVEGLQQWLRFMDTGDSGVIAYTLGEYANNDEWKEILVAYNGNRHEVEIGIPEGEWNVVCRNGQIDPEGKDRLPGGSVKIAASSALILYRQ